jgi:hypothetical protein
MLIEIIEEFITVKAGEKVCEVRVPTIEENDEYLKKYRKAESDEDRKALLKEHLLGLGLEQELYSKMRESHLVKLIEGFQGKKN